MTSVPERPRREGRYDPRRFAGRAPPRALPIRPTIRLRTLQRIRGRSRRPAAARAGSFPGCQHRDSAAWMSRAARSDQRSNQAGTQVGEADVVRLRHPPTAPETPAPQKKNPTIDFRIIKRPDEG